MTPDTLQTADFRRPVPPEPVEVFDIPHPALPPALDGLRILHLSDLHVRRFAFGSERWRRLLDAVSRVRADLVALTGDYTDEVGHEGVALAALQRLADAWPVPRLGAFGVFGNHDTSELLRRAGEVRGVTWLGGPGRAPRWAVPGEHLRLVGLDYPEDFVSAALDAPASPPGLPRPFTIALAHYPTAVIPAAAVGVPLVLAGHTHAGQIRVSSRLAPHTSSDVPPHLAAGVLRLGDTLCCISRGLGDGVMEGLRFNCPRQAPLYVLRRGPLPPPPRNSDPAAVSQVMAW
jgi:predicted MPP superfamily phosphohydrolase